MSAEMVQTNGAAAVTKASAPMTLKAFLDSPQVRTKLAEVATKFLKPEDMIRFALMAASRNPDLMKCTHASILRSLIDAASMGITPGGTMGRGYLVPRMNKKIGALECCFDPGWRGLVDIARRSGAVKSIESQPVYEADEFRVALGDEGTIHHIPALDTDDRGKVIAAYAIATFADGSKQREFLTRADLTKIRNVSMAKSGPWASWEEEMARKSAVRRLCKYLPYDDQLERAMSLADDVDTGERVIADVSAQAEKPRAKALVEKIRARAAVAETEPAPAPVEATEAEGEAVADDGDDLGGRL